MTTMAEALIEHVVEMARAREWPKNLTIKRGVAVIGGDEERWRRWATYALVGDIKAAEVALLAVPLRGA